jgi:hypothetical protein
MEEIMKSHPRCFSLLELAIFIWKKGTHHLLQVGDVAYAGLGFMVYPKPSTLGPWKCHLASSKDHAACFENRLDKKAVKNWPLL